MTRPRLGSSYRALGPSPGLLFFMWFRALGKGNLMGDCCFWETPDKNTAVSYGRERKRGEELHSFVYGSTRRGQDVSLIPCGVNVRIRLELEFLGDGTATLDMYAHVHLLTRYGDGQFECFRKESCFLSVEVLCTRGVPV